MRRSDPDPTHLAVNPAVRRLTKREREVARLVTEGLKDTVIARRLGLSVSTVRNYIGHIKQRLQLTTRVEIATWVTAQLDPDDPTGRLRRLDPARVDGPHPDVRAS
jgi:DNA-binding NarL/FixJ family response regulator